MGTWGDRTGAAATDYRTDADGTSKRAERKNKRRKKQRKREREREREREGG